MVEAAGVEPCTYPRSVRGEGFSCLMSCFKGLLNAHKCGYFAPMSKGKKRVTITPKGNARDGKQKAKVYPTTYKKRGVEYFCYIVRGWKVDGKWQRKQFSDEAKAQDEANSINVNLKNDGEKRRLVLSTLTDEQIEQSEKAFKTLGNVYSLDDAIDFFLKHHRAPDYTISILDGLEIYVAHKKKIGVRVTTTKATKLILTSFANKYDNPLVHTITKGQIKTYLNGLRSNSDDPDNEREKLPAKFKTYNNHRNELASFFIWAGEEDFEETNRPWTFNNPTEQVPAIDSMRVAEQRPSITTTSPETVKELFTYLMNYKEGKLVKWYALAYFAGIRPSAEQGELAKLADREDKLINLTTGSISLPAKVTKTKDERSTRICDNLKAWLEAYKDYPIMPPNLKNYSRHVRKKFNLGHDETRHSFISYHVALHRSIGDTALEAGNSEGMIKKHYLKLHSVEEGGDFFSIVPDLEAGKAVFSDTLPSSETNSLKIVI